MSASNNNASSALTLTQPGQPHGTFVFFMAPPPTVWVQLNDGMQVSFTPYPAHFLQSMLSGTPLFGSMPGNASDSDGVMSMLNELFQRAQAQQNGPPPTSKPFLDNLPVKIWTSDMQKTEIHTECFICLSDYEKDDHVISLPCGHTFHKDYGMTWLTEHNVCPTCRYELPTKAQDAKPAPTEPEQDSTSNITGVRRQRPTEAFHPRDVRQHVDEPALVDEEAELDNMLEEEADRFVKEETEKRQVASNDEYMEIDDRDVEVFLNESASNYARDYHKVIVE